jgi:hypothetical protein
MDKPHLTGCALVRVERQVEGAVCLVREARNVLEAHLRKHPDSRVDAVPPRFRQALSDALTIYDEVNEFFVRVSRG